MTQNLFLEQITTTAAAPYIRTLFLISLSFLIAYGISLLSERIARRIMQLSSIAPQGRGLRSERLQTLHGLIAGAVSFLAFATATLFSVGLFVGLDTLMWIIGLFSVAFGFGARPLISDFLTGVSFLFEDTFDVGEKVEILDVEGVVEQVNLRTTLLRSPSGELFVMPNGEVRVVRNFSRGRFSSANVTIQLDAADLTQALPLLESLGQEAVSLLPHLLEPWQVISPSGAIGQQTELTLVTKVRFGKAAEVRPRLLLLIQERLEAAGIRLGS